MPVTQRVKTFAVGDQVPSASLNTMQDNAITVSAELGDPTALVTQTKASAVAAINELVTRLATAGLVATAYDFTMGFLGPLAVATGLDYLVVTRACTITGLKAMLTSSVGTTQTRFDVQRASISAGALGAFASILTAYLLVPTSKKTTDETGGSSGTLVGGAVALAAGDVLRLDCLDASGADSVVVSIKAQAASL